MFKRILAFAVLLLVASLVLSSCIGNPASFLVAEEPIFDSPTHTSTPAEEKPTSTATATNTPVPVGPAFQMEGEFFYTLCDEFIEAGINEDCPIVPRDQLLADARYLELLENGEPTGMVITLEEDEAAWCGWEELPCEGALVMTHLSSGCTLVAQLPGTRMIGNIFLSFTDNNFSVENFLNSPSSWCKDSVMRFSLQHHQILTEDFGFIPYDWVISEGEN